MGKNSGHEKAPVLAGAEALGNEINFGEEIVMGDNSTAASRVIPFRSAKLLLVERDGQPFVPMKPVVEGMGLAWQSQHRKLMAGRFASTITEMVIVAQDGKQREMTCLPLRKLTGWLMSIHPNKVRPELREGIIAYQNECDDVLWAYWNEGAAVRRDDRTAASVLATTIGTDGFHCLAAVVDGKVRHLPSAIRRGAKNHIWSQVHKAFSVVTAEDIPADQLDSARNFIAAYALEGEWLPKDKSCVGRRHLLVVEHCVSGRLCGEVLEDR
ncbi:phage antirepressor N-terminal domain-containing protein (plasmid) [Pseudomonas aeruginosa]|uniref:phage antirepressor N-terminal domain-containing protein n=1 Tax=Pseudomonas aeruginosa TaxID=287 RepID=UPI001D186B3B|nr:phage antirepressor N-terminal domain-containing protein [Pseudomonas aeruginosa]UEG09402.1 phage antirepressor N-terminal domain-containing protein [Pseudomonas aeruginosa]